MTETVTQQATHLRERPFPISVNRKPVKVDGPKTTGLDIKKAAVEQGVAIELDFQLAKVRADGKQQIVGNDEVVDLRESKTFYATDGDDNS